ncbi:endolytic transglycosylase MltG [Spongiactinospora rosea]|uniref:Endolytic murein transglycosylase n=1 Tax=Spongiactinospora rosea TaxID=2248750 RepID=A0A366LU15_9ACTN|nr:endolytic transglycosylase MltG [Spongiactinospora rosea]RBQ16804.1 endolytic transglycosylase MltG [Spongiactinospora rosea]
MNIENLLRDTLADMAGEEPPPAPGRFLQGRPRWFQGRGLALVAAGAVTALAVGSTAVLHGLSSSRVPLDVAVQRNAITVTVPEGTRLARVFEALSSRTGRPVADFERAAKDGAAALGLPSYARGRLEGFAFPGTYEFAPTATPGEILGAMVARYRRAAEDTALAEGARRAGRTPLEILTVASIVQAEAFRPGDMPKIARVLYNRLDRKMRLQVDSTLLYGLGKYGVSATREDIISPSPYNTYKHLGLPPGPIGSPGTAAIRAALHPASGRWLYFVVTDPAKGTMKFTSSHEEYTRLAGIRVSR